MNLDTEISQLNTIINRDRLIITCVEKVSGKLNVFLNGQILEVMEQNE